MEIGARSSAQGSERYVIFCVGLDQRIVMAFRAWARARGLKFKSLNGCYKGQTEDSFIINAKDFRKVAVWTQNQESILLLGPCNARDQRPAMLLYQDGGQEFLGWLRSVPANQALSSDAWTYDPTQDAYFVCRREA
jgi:hypothetical protein